MVEMRWENVVAYIRFRTNRMKIAVQVYPRCTVVYYGLDDKYSRTPLRRLLPRDHVAVIGSIV